MKTKILPYLHAALTIVLAVFFINAGVKKFMPKDLKPIEEQTLVEQVIVQNSYDAPIGYNLTMNTMRQSGFLKMIGIFQILSGVAMLIPVFRFMGLLLLLPIIFNIFFMHVFMDNRMHENIETGILLAVNLVLISYYYKQILTLLKVRGRKI